MHPGSFETVLAEEDREQDSDRWCSHTPAGQACWPIVSQWVWNLHLEFGHQLSPTTMRLTELAPPQAVESAQVAQQPHMAQPAHVPPAVWYRPPQWARQSDTKGFAGADFSLQPDGTDAVSGRPSLLSARAQTATGRRLAPAVCCTHRALPSSPPVSRTADHHQTTTGPCRDLSSRLIQTRWSSYTQ